MRKSTASSVAGPVQISKIVALPKSRMSTSAEIYTVPAGMRLVIEYVSFACSAQVHDAHARGPPSDWHDPSPRNRVARCQHAFRLERLVRRLAGLRKDPRRSQDGGSRSRRTGLPTSFDGENFIQRTVGASVSGQAGSPERTVTQPTG